VLFAMPSVMLGSTSLILDRLVGTHFYNPARGGDVLLWQHLFWFFGHPEVYLIFIPPLGFISTIIATFARRPVFGYTAMVLSLIAIAFLAFGLWVHHMFATNLPEIGKAFFTAASLAIALPSGVQIFCWLATLITGRLQFRTPLLFVLAFFFILVLGGLSGVMLGSTSWWRICTMCCWAARCFRCSARFSTGSPSSGAACCRSGWAAGSSGCSSSASTSRSFRCTGWACKACRGGYGPIPKAWAGMA